MPIDAKPREESGEMEFSAGDLDDLSYAKDVLEHPGLAAKITSVLGTPLQTITP